MSQFTKPLRIEFLSPKRWKVIDGFEYHVGSYPSKEIIKIPDGFVTDFASVPRALWPIISPIGIHGKAALVHDFLYFSGQYDRKKSDQIFLEGMEVLNVPIWKRKPMYYSVRSIGWNAWRKRRQGIVRV